MAGAAWRHCDPHREGADTPVRGYVIAFWGAGFEVASRMGLLPHLLRTGYAVREVRVVDRNGRKASGFPAAAFARAVSSGFTSLPRGDLAAAVYGALRPFASMKQRAARRFAGALAPKSRMSLFLRNRLFGLFSIGWIAKLIAGREFSDRIALPDY